MLSADEMDDFAAEGGTGPAALVDVTGLARRDVLAPTSFQILQGQITVLVGRDAAPAALARLIAGILPIEAGQVAVDGNPPVVARARGMVAFDAGPRGTDRWSGLLDRVAGQGPRNPARAEKALDRIDVVLSGDAQLVVLDDPFAGIEGPARRQAAESVQAAVRGRDVTLCLATTDIDEAAQLGDRIIVLDGRPARIADLIDMPVTGVGRDSDLIRDLAYRIRQTLSDGAAQ